jgi:aldehyde:ferredoxin oxidoreductase
MQPRTRVLRVDLSARECWREAVPEAWRRAFLGGKGLGARYLYEELSAGTDPTGPENVLAFSIGPLSGYLPGETRYAAVTKSPLTGGFLDSYSGGRFAERLVGSLGDCLGLLVTGVADEPVRIEIEGGDARVEPAETWGEDTVETAEAFPDAAVACIGPAGEQGVAYATIASDAGDHHAGRGGAGAVMGSKRLKAVIARDGPIAVPPALADLHERYAAAYERHETGQWQAAGGTLETVDFANEVGILSTEGWTRTSFEGVEDIGIEAATDRAHGREGDAAGVPGGFRIETDEGEVVPRGGTLITLGAGLGVDEFDAVVALGGVCNRLGIDVISAGNAVAWAIRAGDRGIVDCPIEFGDGAGARRLLEAMAARRDLDDVEAGLPAALADGVDVATERYGGEDLIPTVKSMALPGFDPRVAAGMALAYATSDRGACHRRARPLEREPLADYEWTLEDRVRAVVGEQNARSVLWSLVVDDFAGETLWEDLGAEWLDVFDLPATVEELVDAGERIWTLVRLFNARGWGDRGLPTEATVERLGLSELVDAETPLGAV